jgi:hypothetical protein
MVKRRALLALVFATTLAGSVTVASAAGSTATRSAGSKALVSHQLARSESPLTSLAHVRVQLIMAFRISLGVVLVDLDLSTEGNDYELDTLQDGGENVDPLGAKDNGIRQDGTIPVTWNSPVRQ